MMHEARKAFFEKIRKQAEVINNSGKKRVEARKKVTTHKFRTNGNTKTNGIER